MKIQYCSDLHLEFQDNSLYIRENPIEPSGSILLLAGDIIYLAEQYFKLAFFDYCSEHFKATYMICGNHEFYNGVDVATYQGSFCKAVRTNVFIVNNMVIQIEQVNFVFSTLWSLIGKNKSYIIEQGLNDFHKIRYGSKRLSAGKYNSMFESSFLFLQEALLANITGKTIVVTHHAPSPLCNAPEHINSQLNDAFFVDLGGFISKSSIVYWIYGHTHWNIPKVEINGAKLLTNQLGYVKLNEHCSFKNNATISVV